MGTSASSNGPGPSVSLDPPWLKDIDIPNNGSPPESLNPQDNDYEILLLPRLAPPARFKSARTDLGKYLRSGNKDSLRRSLGHYAKTGMGGSKNLANRMRVSTSVGAGLFYALQTVRDGSNQTLSALFNKLKAEGAAAYRYIGAIVEHICPRGGSLDEVSSQNSVHSALSDFLEQNPTADISNLSDDNLWSLTAHYLSHETFGRIQRDIGKSFEKEDISLSDRMTRIREIQDYIEAEISAQINGLRSDSDTQSPQSLLGIMNAAIEKTFYVFEVEV